MKQWQGMIECVLKNGEDRADRTGVGTRSMFGMNFCTRLDLGAFPLVTTRKINFRAALEETLWFIRGEDNVRSLQERGVHIWDKWAGPDGSVGPIYGYQWRHWGEEAGVHSPWEGLDQIAELERAIDVNPWSRRHLVTAWNPTDLPDMALPPCHCFFQVYVHGDQPSGEDESRGPAPRALSMKVYMRSLDLIVGFPFDLAGYALLLRMLAKAHGLQARWLMFDLGDVHIYKNHLDAAHEILRRDPRVLPALRVVDRDQSRLDDFEAEDFHLEGYDAWPAIRLEVAV